MKLRIIK